MRREQLHKINRIATWLIAGMAVANVAWLIAARSTWDEVVFRGLQYVAMLLIMYLPRLLRSRFRIGVPSEALLHHTTRADLHCIAVEEGAKPLHMKREPK